MRVESIRLENFRNYRTLDLELDGRTNLFYGDNAQGKTNILEAVYLCGTTKSHRGTRDRDMIRFGGEEAHIRMSVVKKDIPYRIDMHLRKNKGKAIAINGVPVRKASELLGLCSFIFFSPEDLNIIKNGPAERRRFMDMELCQIDRVYVSGLSAYNRVLMQRNQLLRDMYSNPRLEDTLDIWDEQLVRYGTVIIKARREFVRRINELTGPIHYRLTSGREEMMILYENNVNEDDFALRLRESRDKDIRLKMSHTGPHRDDLLFRTGEIDIRRFGSQGQQRTTALSLKLAEINLVKEVSGDEPVLLLDDVLSELDSGRQHDLLENISGIQTLITGTGMEEFAENHFRIDRLFRVSEGTAAAEDGNEV